jgi:glycine oxidase
MNSATLNSLPEGAEVVIVGAGIMGCGLAWRLGQAGRRVVVVDRAEPGSEASTAAAGILAAQIEAQGSSALLELALASRALYPRWAQALKDEVGMDIGLRRCGVLMLAASEPALRESDLHAQASLLSEQRSRGLSVETLSPDQLRRLEPALADSAGALLFPDDGQVEPPLLLSALQAAAQRYGVRFVSAAVQRIELSSSPGERHRVLLHRGEGDEPFPLAASQLVLAAGSWSSLITGAPLPPPSIEPVRGQMVELLAAPSILRHVCFGHVPSHIAAGRQPPGATGSQREAGHGYLVPRGDGRIVIGSTTERVGFVKDVTVAGLLDLLTLAEALVPALGHAVVRRTWAGLRPGSRDGLPLIGSVPRRGEDESSASVFVCSGHYRNGILLAPASIEALLARLIRLPLPVELAAVPWAAFSPQRASA